jgi:hypothetical protein
LRPGIARSLKDFSFFPDENELLLPINVEFEVTAVCDLGNELTMVQCMQVESDEPILDIQVDAVSSASSPALPPSPPETLADQLAEMGFSPEQIKEGAKHGTQASQVANWILANSVKQPQQEVQRHSWWQQLWQQWTIPTDIPSLTRALGDSIANASRTTELLEALWSLAANNAENEKRIAAAGGIDRVVQAMAAHVGVAGVQESGCAALWTLAANDENKERIAAAGGIDRVVQAMAAHVGVAGVQESGCGALANLAANDENKERIAAAGGIDRVVQAKKNHPSIAWVADRALGNLEVGNLEAGNLEASN